MILTRRLIVQFHSEPKRFRFDQEPTRAKTENNLTLGRVDARNLRVIRPSARESPLIEFQMLRERVSKRGILLQSSGRYETSRTIVTDIGLG